ncbi:MAG: flagellar export chaperone FliS [Rhodocyclales bacterium]|nr:flagellar export chaperone FliS [Rhodocyclales bacterium]
MFNRRMRGANAYSQVNLETAVQSADPHQLILMLYDGALLSLAEATVAIEQKDVPKRAKAISRAIAIIQDGLHASLDVEAGGELGQRLAALYDYMVERLTQANATNNAATVQEVSGLLRTLREAWAEMPRQQAAAVAG